MLKAKKFTLNGNSTKFVAVYDSNKVSNADAKTYIDEIDGLKEISNTHPNLVILEEKDWKKLFQIIQDNYELKEKQE